MIHFSCNRADPDVEYDATNNTILTLVFNAQEIAGSAVDLAAGITIVDSSVKLGAKGGVNIYVDSATDGVVNILGTTTVNGVVDLQGRDNDSGAVVDPEAGAIYPGIPTPSPPAPGAPTLLRYD